MRNWSVNLLSMVIGGIWLFAACAVWLGMAARIMNRAPSRQSQCIVRNMGVYRQTLTLQMSVQGPTKIRYQQNTPVKFPENLHIHFPLRPLCFRAASTLKTKNEQQPKPRNPLPIASIKMAEEGMDTRPALWLQTKARILQQNHRILHSAQVISSAWRKRQRQWLCRWRINWAQLQSTLPALIMHFRKALRPNVIAICLPRAARPLLLM